MEKSGKIFSLRHALRALRHVLKIKRGDIAHSKAVIPDRYRERYLALLDSGKGWIESKKCSNQSIDESVVWQQESAARNLLRRRYDVTGVINKMLYFVILSHYSIP
jgi:hypothetical protein